MTVEADVTATLRNSVQVILTWSASTDYTCFHLQSPYGLLKWSIPAYIIMQFYLLHHCKGSGKSAQGGD